MSGVGPGRPPEVGRFRKGMSGNPKGRPKSRRASSPSAFNIIMNRTLTVTQGGKPRELSIEEALEHRTYEEAINGKRTKMQDLWTDITPNSHTLTEAHDAGNSVMKPYVISHNTRQ